MSLTEDSCFVLKDGTESYVPDLRSMSESKPVNEEINIRMRTLFFNGHYNKATELLDRCCGFHRLFLVLNFYILKCPYHQNFYFPIWCYISFNELWQKKKFSILIKCDLKTWKSYFIAVYPCRWSRHRHAQICDVD